MAGPQENEELGDGAGGVQEKSRLWEANAMLGIAMCEMWLSLRNTVYHRAWEYDKCRKPSLGLVHRMWELLGDFLLILEERIKKAGVSQWVEIKH